MERIPQSVAKRVVFRAYLASDGKSLATGKTIAITISKNGGAFGNPNAGATNATEISSGFYYFDLGTTDTNTLGPLAWRGAEGTVNDAGDVYAVVAATNGGFSALPAAAADAAGGLPISDAGGLDLDTFLARLDAAISTRLATAGYTAPLDAAGVRNAVGLASANLDTQLADVPTVSEFNARTLAAADYATATALGTVDSIVDAILEDTGTTLPATLGTPAGASLAADVAAVKAQTAAIETDTQDIQARLPAALTGAGNLKADVLALNGSTTAAANIAKTTAAIARGTVTSGATTTSIPTSAFSPAGAAADQFKGRIVTFDADTTTAALRGQSTDITASSNSATPTLTVTALTTAPASGDTFSVT